MKTFTERKAVLTTICFFIITFLSAQVDYTVDVIKSKIDKANTGLLSSDYADVVISSQYMDEHNGVSHIYLQQQYQGIPVEEAIMGVHLDTKGDVAYIAHSFQPKMDMRAVASTPSISAVQAAQNAALSLGLEPNNLSEVQSQRTSLHKTIVSKSNIALQDIPVSLKYSELEDGSIQLVWQAEIYTIDQQHYYVVTVDATTGTVVKSKDLVIRCNFDHASTDAHATTETHTHFLGKASTAARTAAAVPSATNTVFSPQKNNNVTSGSSYRVYDMPVETPNHGNRTLVTTNGDPVASPYGWHYDGTAYYNVTRGNNVFAYYDPTPAGTTIGPGLGGTPALGTGIPGPGASYTFDFPVDLTQDPSTYTDAAITNLFYWNNIIHDVFYHYGFTAPAGNFQFDNLGQGGLGADQVQAEAQDGAGTNNANMLTLPDGASPRMQMFLWSSSSPADLTHVDYGTDYPNGGPSFTSIEAAFGQNPIDATGVSGQLILIEANDNAVAGTPSNGCGSGQGAPLPPKNNVLNKIVLIDRGNCSFIEKVLGAQLGGAKGVIVANNIPGAPPLAMGGDQTGMAVTIPAVMISFEDGQLLKDQMNKGLTYVSLRRDEPAPPMKDGDFDNGIIAHEYGHGISTRLTGGPMTGCLGGDEQGGEGWSDYFGLMMTFTPAQIAANGFDGRGIGTYVIAEGIDGGGIRPARYSRDFAINDYTYARVSSPEITIPHGVGFIWATMLYDMTWDFIDVYGFDNDIYSGTGGNNMALQLVMDALKLQPCSPTFVEMRDAILAADQLTYGGAHQCLIWNAFAKRGLGFSAVSGSNGVGDEIEAFDVPQGICSPSIAISHAAATTLATDGQNFTYNIQVVNTSNFQQDDVLISSPIPQNTSFVSASHNGSNAGGVVTYPAFDILPNDTVNLTFTINLNFGQGTDLTFYDDMETGTGNWLALPGVNQWNLTTAESASGEHAWFAADPDNYSNQILQLAAPITVPANGVMQFTHRYSTETTFDGGVIEISNDGGATWYDLGSQITSGHYTDVIPAANNPFINGPAFGGNSNGYIKTTVNLGQFAGQNVDIRFRMASDVLTPGVGWFVDDVLFGVNPTTIKSTVTSLTPAGDFAKSETENLVLKANSAAKTQAQSQEVVENNKNTLQSTFETSIYPNPTDNVLNVRFDESEGQEFQIQLYNLQGQLMVERTSANDNVVTLDVANLPAGIYLVKIADDYQTKTQKVIIK